ncbi:hypothetical protein [Xanthobacter sp. KR7-225]|uniref:hypothetical protein n=1 Tax=Xanthobacter sp. KR7-225 TaxID=3156613 RepID=UPI0032B500AB
MTPAELANRYLQLRQRTDMHLRGACRDVSVPLPADFGDELAFYRLVNWAYVVLTEAGKLPIAFLISLPPLSTNSKLRTEVGSMRTFVAHNLDVMSPSDYKTRSFAHQWFRTACGVGTPMAASDFAKCCDYLATRLDRVLKGAIEACDSLDDPDEGPSLVTDLRNRIELQWDAHRFDPIVAEAAEAIGNPGLDLLAIRRRHLESWRKTLANADEGQRETALRLKIEATLIAEFADTLPSPVSEISARLAIAGPPVIVAALILLRDVRRFAPFTVPEILAEVSKEVRSD